MALSLDIFGVKIFEVVFLNHGSTTYTFLKFFHGTQLMTLIVYGPEQFRCQTAVCSDRMKNADPSQY